MIKKLKETNNLLFINKPSGLVVHPDGRTKEETLCDWILENYPEVKGVGEPLILSDGTVVDKPGIVHRLDRDTSGVMVIAKTQEAFLHLKEQFKNHSVKKEYHAFVYGHLKEDEGTIDRPIGKSKKDFRQWSAQRGARGMMRSAVTNFKVIERGESDGERVTLVAVMPETGRTHQIRVHMKAINHPLVSDTLYAPKRPSVLGFTRTALHAVSLTVSDIDGESISVQAPYSPDFESALKIIAQSKFA